MSLQDPSTAPCFKEFDKCCFCIDLKPGAHVLGIFSIIGGIFWSNRTNHILWAPIGLLDACFRHVGSVLPFPCNRVRNDASRD